MRFGIVTFVAILVCTSFVHAQTGFERTLDLTFAPAYPAPGDTVGLSVSTFALDLSRSTVAWYANEKEFARGVGLTETTRPAGNAGETTTINVVAEDEEGIVATASGVIRPAVVDILWEANSYVPPFYEGRTLPGSSSTIRAQAVARFKAVKAYVPDSEIVYTWYRNDSVVTSGRGKSSVTLPGPLLFGTDVIRVTAISADKMFSGEAQERITSTDPFPLLYENHPLFGILFHRALVGSANTLETEQKMTAVPYFANVTSLSDPSLQFDWEVSGVNIAPDTKEPGTLTFTTDGYSGPLDIELSLTSLSDIAMRAVGKWQLIFGNDGSSVFTGTNANPFGGTQ